MSEDSHLLKALLLKIRFHNYGCVRHGLFFGGRGVLRANQAMLGGEQSQSKPVTFQLIGGLGTRLAF